MRHRVSVKKLSKTPAHRKAMIRNMLISLYRYEQIKTTFAKSKVLQKYAERLITTAKKDTVHNRRMVAKWIQDKEILNKLFVEIAPKYVKRPGGYTRIIKIGPRYGDATEMVYISLVEEEINQKKKKGSEKSKVVAVDSSKKTSKKEVIAKEVEGEQEKTKEITKGSSKKAEDTSKKEVIAKEVEEKQEKTKEITKTSSKKTEDTSKKEVAAAKVETKQEKTKEATKSSSKKPEDTSKKEVTATKAETKQEKTKEETATKAKGTQEKPKSL